MEDFIVIAILLAIAGVAAWYLIRAKRRGEHCVGCPHGKTCTGKCGCEKKPEAKEK